MERIYIGKSCPYCKTPLQKDDVVVFCNTCDMPHHLSCWQANKGCATFGCTGFIDTIINQDKVKTGSQGQSNDTGNVSTTTVLQESPKPKSDGLRFETLSEFSEGKLQDESEILIEKVTLIKDHNDDSIFARCSFRSLTDNPIKALLLDVNAVDAWGNPVQGMEGFQLLDLKTKRDAVFGQTTPIPLPDKNTRGVEVVIKKILFEDRSMVDCKESFTTIPLQQSLSDYFGDGDMAAEYIRETSDSSKYVPCEGEKIWRCSCGAINDSGSENCYRCKAEKKQLLSLLNSEQIRINSDRYLEEKRVKAEAEQKEREERQREAEERLRKAQEEKERQDREAAEARKARKRKIVKRIICSIAGAILLAATVYGTGWHLIPFIRYSVADLNVKKCNFDSAYDTYVALGDYKDSSSKAIETVYAKGEYLIGQKQYNEAAAEFERIPEYQDSTTKAVYCRNEASYLAGIGKYNENDFDAAIEIFTDLGEYSDSKAWIKKTEYAYAKACFEKEDYSKAFDLFTKLRNYDDSKDRADESKFMMAEKAFEAKDYETAYTCYSSLSESYQGSGEKAKESQYMYACDCMDKKEYKAASDAFGSSKLKGYKESATKFIEASYLYAKECYESKEYEEANVYFAKAAGYEDADTLWTDSKYNNALNLIKNKDYKKAVNILNNLENYKESKIKINEAKYAYVKAHKNDTDETTYSYLKDLIAADYMDSQSIYDDLYAWSAVIVINSSETDDVTSSVVSKDDKIYCHYTINGGPPGEHTKIKLKFEWPDGDVTNRTAGDGYRGYSSCWTFWYSTPRYGATGTGTFTLYDGNGNKIGEETVRIIF